MFFWNFSKAPYLANNDSATLYNFINSVMQNDINTTSNFTVVQNVTSTTLGGMPALQWVGTWNHEKNPQYPVKELLVYTLRGDNIYSVGYVAGVSYFASTLSDAQQVINSFAFT